MRRPWVPLVGRLTLAIFLIANGPVHLLAYAGALSTQPVPGPGGPPHPKCEAGGGCCCCEAEDEDEHPGHGPALGNAAGFEPGEASPGRCPACPHCPCCPAGCC